MDGALRAQSAVASAMAEASLAREDPAGALVHGVEALRHAPWARVELFGHSVRIGIAREVERFGRRWIEVVQPALWRDPELADDPARDDPDLPVTVKLYHPNAVYAIEEYDDDAEGERAYRNSRGVRWPDDPYEL